MPHREQRIAEALKQCQQTQALFECGPDAHPILFKEDVMDATLCIRYSCATCGLFCPDAGVCKQCGIARYCSRQCQVAAWHRIHKKTCKSTTEHPSIDAIHNKPMADAILMAAEYAPAHVLLLGALHKKLALNRGGIDSVDDKSLSLLATTTAMMIGQMNDLGKWNKKSIQWIWTANCIASAKSASADRVLASTSLPITFLRFAVEAGPNWLGLDPPLSMIIVECSANLISCLQFKDGMDTEMADLVHRIIGLSLSALVSFPSLCEGRRLATEAVLHPLLNIVRNSTFLGIPASEDALVAAWDACSCIGNQGLISIWCDILGNMMHRCNSNPSSLQRLVVTFIQDQCASV